ncbi:MAG: flagellar protein FlgN, partial [Nitrospirae bacterium]|nr:flagellar protein FlgN [Nitrospirota bacterium]
GLLQKEKDVIVSLDPNALEQLLGAKEAISTNIRMCDEARERILERLGFSNKTISQVASVADDEYKDRLKDIASRFTSVIQSITELNKLNGKLIEKSLYYVKASYNFLNTFGVSAHQKVSVEA